MRRRRTPMRSAGYRCPECPSGAAIKTTPEPRDGGEVALDRAFRPGKRPLDQSQRAPSAPLRLQAQASPHTTGGLVQEPLTWAAVWCQTGSGKVTAYSMPCGSDRSRVKPDQMGWLLQGQQPGGASSTGVSAGEEVLAGEMKPSPRPPG